MPAGTPWRDYLADLRTLEGEPKVTFDGGDLAYPITERVLWIGIGEEPAYASAEPDAGRFPSNVLVKRQELRNDGHFVEVYLQYIKVPGKVVTFRSWDEEHHVWVYSDHYMDVKGATLPAENSVRSGKYVVRTAESPLAGSTLAEMVIEYMEKPANRVDIVPRVVNWPGWFEPKRSRDYQIWQANELGGYSVVNLADLVESQGDELVVYYPLNLVRPPGISLFQLLFRQGVNIDAMPPRAREVATRRTRIYYAGNGAFNALLRQMPKTLQVMAPGARSTILGSLIGSNTVHPAFKIITVDLDNDYGPLLLEDVEESNPPRYDPRTVYCIGARIGQARGGLHFMEILEATEQGSLGDLNTERKVRIPFTASAVNFVNRMNELAGSEQGFLLYCVSTSGTDNDSGKQLRIVGRRIGGGATAGVNPVTAELLTLGEANIAVPTTLRWFRLYGVQLVDANGDPVAAAGNITVAIGSAKTTENHSVTLAATGAGAVGDTVTIVRSVGGISETLTYTWGTVGGEITRLRIRSGSADLPAGSAGSPQNPLVVGISHGATRYGIVVYRSDVGEWDNGESYYTGTLPESISSANAIEVGVTSSRTATQLRGDIKTVIDASHSAKWTTATSDPGGGAVTVYATGAVGALPSLAVIGGFPCIAFPGDAFTNIHFSYNSAANGTGTWTTVNAVTAGIGGGNVSLCEVSGNPAIAYTSSANDVTYVRASNSTGSAWGSPVTVVSPDDTNGPLCLLVVNGNPALVYHNSTTGELCYVRASNATGSAWGSPVVIENVGALTTAAVFSMAIVNGRPAVAYRAETGQELKYCRASDASGTAWGSPVVVDSDAADTGNYCSLAVINGKPSISYLDGSNLNLLYIRSLDENGAAWASNATLVASTGSLGQHTSLLTVSGRPAIAFYDTTNTQLLFVRASDTTGATWGAPEIVDTTGDVGEWVSMAIVDGNPAVAYLDDTNDDLMFARNTASDGSDPWTTAYDLLFTHVTKGAVTNSTLNNAGSWVGTVATTQEAAAANTIAWSGVAATAASNLEAVLGNPTTAIAAGLAGVGTTTLAAITAGTVTVSRLSATVTLTEPNAMDLSYTGTTEAGGTLTVTLPADSNAGTVVATIAQGTSSAYPATSFDNSNYREPNLLPKLIVTTDPIGVNTEGGLGNGTWKIGVGVRGETPVKVEYDVSNNLTDWTAGAGELNGRDMPINVVGNSINQAALKTLTPREYLTHTFSGTKDTKYVRLRLTAVGATGSVWVDAFAELPFPTS